MFALIKVLIVILMGSAIIGGVMGQDPTSSTLPPILLPEATVTIPELGKIQGLKWWTSTTLKPFYVFHGIPYAKSVSGDKRFKPSELWEGPLTNDGSTFMALDPLIVCPQGFFGKKKASNINATSDLLLNIIKSGLWKWTEEVEETPEVMNPQWSEDEDCLVININTPKIPLEGEANPKYPVIFFIHGGSSTQVFGSPFTGFRFLEHEVILVTINYRLGVLGALNLGINDAPGNAAMYDCLTALDWVHKHIHHFGGDKDRIVVYGHSAGSMMASHLLLSPLAAGKFTGIIGASGSALATWGTSEEDYIGHQLKVVFNAGCCVTLEYNFCNAEGIPTNNIDYQKIYECMRDTDESILRSALSKYSNDEQRKGGLGFDAKVPSVQNSPAITIPKFLSEMPIEILRKGKQNPVNVIMGATRHDGSFAFDDVYLKYIVANNLREDSYFLKNELLPMMMNTMKNVDRSGAFPTIVGQTYFGNRMKAGKFSEMLPGMIDLTSIWGFKAPSYELVTKHARVNPNSWYYSFDFMGFWTTCDLSGKSDIPCGVPHIDDMSFTFQIFPLINTDLRVSQRMVKYFVNFATYGTPNSPLEDDDLLNWPSYDAMTHPFLKIDAEDSIQYDCRDKWIDNGLEIVDFDDNGKVMFNPLAKPLSI